eukprot:361720-Chlamydomonas_euryale.AAC.3
MPARRSEYGQPNIHTRLADEDKSLFVTHRVMEPPGSQAAASPGVRPLPNPPPPHAPLHPPSTSKGW